MEDNYFISLIIPTYNESENIADTLKRSYASLEKLAVNFEVLVVDDSSQDLTAEIAEKILKRNGRVIRREKERSLSISVLEGIGQAKGNIIVVMDADGSHPPELIQRFFENIKQGYDLIIASRYIKGGGTKEFPLSRKIISRVACLLGNLVSGIKDNTSGFFCFRKERIQGSRLTPKGFKIGLEIFVKGNFTQHKEIPLVFTNRKYGKSKFSLKPVLEYIIQIYFLFLYKHFKINI